MCMLKSIIESNRQTSIAQHARFDGTYLEYVVRHNGQMFEPNVDDPVLGWHFI